VVVRAIGSDLQVDYSAIGQTTHLAARMEQLAAPGSIRVTAHTLRLAEGYVEARSLGPVPVKGLETPVEVYDLVGADPQGSRLHASSARGLTRLVGRDRELGALAEGLLRVAAGRGQVVAVVGEPGVGKSRLVWEVSHSSRGDGWRVLHARSVPYGKAMPYLPIIDLLKGYFEIDARDDARAIREKVTGRLLALDAAMKPALSPILALLDASPDDAEWQNLDPPQRRRRTLDAVKRLLLRESQLQPLLVVFEDLHWIDNETQAFLDGLVDSTPTARLLLLVTYRPEYLHRWVSKTYYTQLRLDPLPPESAGQLLSAVLGSDAGARSLGPLLIDRTQGNPFFLEETLSALVETGVLTGERGAYHLTRPVGAVAVPATVQAVLASRIDRLPPAEKALLQMASVIGKDVPFALLRAIAGYEEDDLRGTLAELHAAEFLYEARLFPDLEYTFKHALTHEVAYSSLLHERRRTLHGRLVPAIEQLYPDRLAEQVDSLAHHAFRGEVWDKAVVYLSDAGTRALGRSANREAAAYFEQAVAAIERLPQDADAIRTSIDLRVHLRTSLMPLGEEHDRIIEHLRVGERLAAQLGDSRRQSRMIAFQAHISWLAADPVRATELSEQALAHAERESDLGLTVLASFFLGQACHSHGDYRRGIAVLTANIDRLSPSLLGERFGMGLPASVVTRVWLAFCLSYVGCFGEARARAEEAAQITRALGPLPYSEFHSLVAAGLVASTQGDPASAIPKLERALELARNGGLNLMVTNALAWLAHGYLVGGRASDAVAALEESLSQKSHLRFGAFQHHSVALLAEAQLQVGNVIEAEHLAAKAVESCRRQHQRGLEADSLRVLAETAAHPSRLTPERAVAGYREALALASELGMRPLVAHCRLGLGNLCRLTGDRDQAREHLAVASKMYDEMDMPTWRGHVAQALQNVT
jgi:tetratricopeptide (TPR) repeat protein